MLISWCPEDKPEWLCWQTNPSFYSSDLVIYSILWRWFIFFFQCTTIRITIFIIICSSGWFIITEMIPTFHLVPTSDCWLLFVHCDCTTLLLSVNMTKSIWILALWHKKNSLLPVKQLIRLSLCPLWCYFLVYKQSPIKTHDKKGLTSLALFLMLLYSAGMN